MKAFGYKLSANGDLSFNIAGVIGDGWAEPDSCCTASAMRAVLKDAPNAKNIEVGLDTDGGDWFDGVAMYQMLSEHPATVNVTVGARAQSAGSLIAMAGDTISMSETSVMLAHKPWGVRIGDATDLRKAADDLDVLTETAVTAYAARTGMEPDAIRKLMAEDRLMSATEALELGFCTMIRKAKPKSKALSESQAKAQVYDMRANAQARLTERRVAAMAPTPAADEPPTPAESSAQLSLLPQQPEGLPAGHKDQTNMETKVFLSALGLPEGATIDQVLAFATQAKATTETLAKLTAALGAKTSEEAVGIAGALVANRDNVDGEGHVAMLSALGAKGSEEALGKIAALNDAKERLAVLETESAEASAKRAQGERESLVQKIKDDGKLTPAQENAEWFRSLSIDGLKGFAETAVPILKGDGRKQPRSTPLASKKWEDMSSEEQRQLHDTDPAAFNATYTDYNNRSRQS